MVVHCEGRRLGEEDSLGCLMVVAEMLLNGWMDDHKVAGVVAVVDMVVVVVVVVVVEVAVAVIVVG